MRWWGLGLVAACNGDDPPATEPTDARVLEGPLVGRGVAVRDGAVWLSAPGIAGDGAVYRFDGATSAGLDQADLVAVGAAAGDVGDAFAPCDLDGDGALDLVVGSPDRDDQGGAWFVAGPLGAVVDLAEAVHVPGFREGGRSGASLACGDVSGDGTADVAIGAPDTDGEGIATQTGTVDLFAGPAASPDKFANVDTTWSDSHLGFRTALVAGVDLDGDGIGDLVAGAGGADRVHLVFGPIAGSVFTNQAGPTLSGATGDGTGHALAAGDVDGDGDVDLVVGAPLSDGAQGAVWIAPGPFDPAGLDGPIAAVASRVEGVGEGDQAGFAVAVPGDLDGDGADDLGIGAPYAGGVGVEAGAAYVVYGPGDLLGDLDGAHALLLGDVARGRLGWAVAGGDLTGDGAPEIVVSAPEADVDGGIGVGVAYVFGGDVAGVTYPDQALAGYSLRPMP